MNGKAILLDTNIIINHFKDETLFAQQLIENEYYVPQITVGELYGGAHKSARPEHHCQKIQEFLTHGEVVEMNLKTSIQYGEIWAALAKIGKLIPTNDIWIAALALQYGFKLISNDKHFANIDGLDYESW